MIPRLLHEMFLDADAQLHSEEGSSGTARHGVSPLDWAANLPEIPAVYMVSCEFSTLLYVGQTTNLHQRFLRHHRLPTFRALQEKTHDLLIRYQETHPAHLQTHEAALIAAAKPPWNTLPVKAPPVFVGTWISQALWERLTAYAYGYGMASGTQCDIPECVASILADYFA